MIAAADAWKAADAANLDDFMQSMTARPDFLGAKPLLAEPVLEGRAPITFDEEV